MLLTIIKLPYACIRNSTLRYSKRLKIFTILNRNPSKASQWEDFTMEGSRKKTGPNGLEAFGNEPVCDTFRANTMEDK